MPSADYDEEAELNRILKESIDDQWTMSFLFYYITNLTKICKNVSAKLYLFIFTPD